jgi:hydrogenase 3 maturation protease
MNFSDLTQRLQPYAKEKIVFIGLGNTLRGDDAAGLILLKKIEQLSAFKNSHFISAGANPENYLQKILEINAEVVIFLDTAQMGLAPGTIAFVDSKSLAKNNFSTHTYSIAMVEEYLTMQQNLDFIYLGIEPVDTRINRPLSPAVRRGIDQLIGDIQ